MPTITFPGDGSGVAQLTAEVGALAELAGGGVHASAEGTDSVSYLARIIGLAQRSTVTGVSGLAAGSGYVEAGVRMGGTEAGGDRHGYRLYCDGTAVGITVDDAGVADARDLSSRIAWSGGSAPDPSAAIAVALEIDAADLLTLYLDTGAGLQAVGTCTDSATPLPAGSPGGGFYAGGADPSAQSMTLEDRTVGGAIPVALPTLDARAQTQAMGVRRAVPNTALLSALDARAEFQPLGARRDLTAHLPVLDARANWGGPLGVGLPLGPLDARAVTQAMGVSLSGIPAPIPVALPVLDARATTQALGARRDFTVALEPLDARAAFRPLAVRRAISAMLPTTDARALWQPLGARRDLTAHLPVLDARASTQPIGSRIAGPVLVRLPVLDARAVLQPLTMRALGVAVPLDVVTLDLTLSRRVGLTATLRRTLNLELTL